MPDQSLLEEVAKPEPNITDFLAFNCNSTYLKSIGAGTKVTSAIDEFDDDSFEGSLYEEPVVTKPRGNSIDKTSNPKGIDTESEEVNGLREDTELASFEISEDDEDLSLRDIVKTKAGAKGKIAEPPKKPSPRLNHNIVSDKGVSDDEDSDEIFGNGNAKKNVKMTYPILLSWLFISMMYL